MKNVYWDFFKLNGSVEAYLLYRGLQEQNVKVQPGAEAAIEQDSEGAHHPGDAGGGVG